MREERDKRYKSDGNISDKEIKLRKKEIRDQEMEMEIMSKQNEGRKR